VSPEDRAKDVVQKCEGLGVRAFAVKGDAGNAEDNARIVKETVEKLGGLDIVVANAGWTRFSDFKDLNALSHEEWNKVRLRRRIYPCMTNQASAGHAMSCAISSSCKPPARSSMLIPKEASTSSLLPSL